MTIAARITALFVAIATGSTLLLTLFVAQRDYHRALDHLVAWAPENIQSHPEYQLHVYNKREFSLRQLLSKFLKEHSVVAALTYDPTGKVLGEETRIEAAYYSAPGLKSIRSTLSVAETGLSAPGETGTGFWASVFSPGDKLHLSSPVLSPINPGRIGLEAEDFTRAWAEPERNDSQMVMGYIHLVIDRGLLLQTARTAVARTMIGALLFTLLTSLALYYVLRRLTAPMIRLAVFAEAITTGEASKTLAPQGEAQFIAITKALNSIVEQQEERQSSIGVEHKLLKMRAEKSATDLSDREQALTQANAQIDAAKEQLHRLANFDKLTTLPNQRLFREQLGLLMRLGARETTPVAVLCLCINDFSRINESLGRAAGDHVLKVVSKRILTCIRDSDVLGHSVDTDQNLNVSRFNGDEFAVVLNKLERLESARRVAERMVKVLLKPIKVDDHEISVIPSIGIAGAPTDGNTPDELLESATTAMQSARASRDENIQLYDANIAISKRSELKLETALRKAIENSELELQYQPQVDTGDGSIVSAEALLRWEHPRLGSISPLRFIPIAERMGMMVELGDWALQQSCRQMKAFLDSGLELPRIAVNISPQQVNSGFVDRVKAILSQTGLSGAALELSFSESILVESDTRLFSVLRELKKLGVHLSLENFGTSPTPMGYLSRHPFDELKLDRSFVAECHRRPDAGRMVKAITAMALSLGLRPVAEGVETESEYQYLTQQGVRIMRGYLFSKPLPASELQRQLVVPWHYMEQVQRMTLSEQPRPGGPRNL
jgi:diguanylate cyclase (GGDEF)-like protein